MTSVATTPHRLASAADFAAIVDNFDTFLLDCDGVLWSGEIAIDGVTEVLQMLRSKGKQLLFVTNTAAKSRRDCKIKFDKLGIYVELDEIFCASYVAALYISEVIKLSPSDKVYLIAMSGTKEEFANHGISWIGPTSPEDNTLDPFDLASFERDPDVKVVLFGGDPAINYTKLSKAFQYLQGSDGREGCTFLCINLDNTVPGKGGMYLGAGLFALVLSTALGKRPLLIGKPERIMWDCIQAKYSVDPSRTIMIGDTIASDVAFGKNIGIPTILVMTGTTSHSVLEATVADQLPDYVVNSLGELRVLDDPIHRDAPESTENKSRSP